MGSERRWRLRLSGKGRRWFVDRWRLSRRGEEEEEEEVGILIDDEPREVDDRSRSRSWEVLLLVSEEEEARDFSAFDVGRWEGPCLLKANDASTRSRWGKGEEEEEGSSFGDLDDEEEVLLLR